VPTPVEHALGAPTISAVARSAPARSAAASAARAPPSPPVGALTSTPSEGLEELPAAQRVERHARDPGDRRKNEQAERSALADRHDQLVGDVRA